MAEVTVGRQTLNKQALLVCCSAFATVGGHFPRPCGCLGFMPPF